MELVLVLAAIVFAMPVVVNTTVNVVVAPPYELVHFKCEAQGDFLVWLVDSNALTNATKEEREIIEYDLSSNGTQHSILTITALPINDGIHIGCVVGIAPYYVTFYNTQRLKVRGVSSVKNLTLSFTPNNSLLVSWSPPYHSNDVSNESLSYEVTVTNGNKTFIHSSIVHTNIKVSNVTACDTFNVSIKALVEQYSSIISAKKNKRTTYHVQNLHLKPYSNGSVGVKCLYYCEPVASVGCHVIFKDIAQGIQKYFNITGLHEKLVPLTNNGYYTVTVYDLVNGSVIGPVLEFEVNILSSSMNAASSSPTSLPLLTIAGIVSGSIIMLLLMLCLVVIIMFLMCRKSKRVYIVNKTI